MSLFGARKVTGATHHEIVHLIHNYFKGRGLDHHAQELPGAEGCGWWLTEGSAKVYVFVHDSPAGAVLRITSPIVYLPENNREQFLRHLLDLNSNLSSCHLATYDNYVLVLTQRQPTGMTQDELDSIVWNVAYVADLLDDRLATEYQTQLYKP